MSEHAMPDPAPSTNGLFEIIRTTRSMRRLKPEPVPHDLIRKIVQAALCAPRGGNMLRALRGEHGRRKQAEDGDLLQVRVGRAGCTEVSDSLSGGRPRHCRRLRYRARESDLDVANKLLINPLLLEAWQRYFSPAAARRRAAGRGASRRLRRLRRSGGGCLPYQARRGRAIVTTLQGGKEHSYQLLFAGDTDFTGNMGNVVDCHEWVAPRFPVLIETRDYPPCVTREGPESKGWPLIDRPNGMQFVTKDDQTITLTLHSGESRLR